MNEASMRRVQVVDSHTGGEPTRIIVDAGLAALLGNGSLTERLRRMRKDHDWIRRATVLEPRGSEVMVGAIVCPPESTAHTAAVIFFNNHDYLGMCGHGIIGLAVTLAHLGRFDPGAGTFETPVGAVRVELHDAHRVTVENVPAYRYRSDVHVDVPGLGVVAGDIAWGGNWFFLVRDHGEALTLANAPRLTEVTSRIKRALGQAEITGDDGAGIDHIELFGPPADPQKAHSRNFVLCPGNQFDRSPCGTGTSAKLACLAAEGRLAAGDVWLQESITGSVFEARYRPASRDGVIVPSITGSAYVTARAELLIDPADPFGLGI